MNDASETKHPFLPRLLRTEGRVYYPEFWCDALTFPCLHYTFTSVKFSLPPLYFYVNVPYYASLGVIHDSRAAKLTHRYTLHNMEVEENSWQVSSIQVEVSIALLGHMHATFADNIPGFIRTC